MSMATATGSPSSTRRSGTRAPAGPVDHGPRRAAHAWDADFCRGLAAEGFYVIRYDNRDVGLSTWLDEAGDPDIGALLGGTGRRPMPSPTWPLTPPDCSTPSA